MFYMCLSQGICYECGPDGSQCAKVGYSAIDYYKTALSKTSSKKDPKAGLFFGHLEKTQGEQNSKLKKKLKLKPKTQFFGIF